MGYYAKLGAFISSWFVVSLLLTLDVVGGGSYTVRPAISGQRPRRPVQTLRYDPACPLPSLPGRLPGRLLGRLPGFAARRLVATGY